MKRMIIAAVVMTVALSASRADNVARVGDTEYATLSAACAAASDGETVTMISDYSLPTFINVTGTRSIVIDLNGHTLTAPSGEKAFQVVENGSLTINDTQGTGVITSVQTNQYLRIIIAADQGSVTINGGNFVYSETAPNSGRGCCFVYVSGKNASAVINNCTMTSTVASTSTAYGLIHNAGTTTINGGTITNTCTVSSSNSLAYRTLHNNGTLNLMGGDITSEKGQVLFTYGGTVNVGSGVSLDGTMNNNSINEYVLTDNADFRLSLGLTAARITYNRGASNTFGTVCLPFAPDADENITYYRLLSADADGGVLTLQQEATPQAHTPYIYYTANGTYSAGASNVTLSADPVAGETTYDGWTLHGVYARTSVFASADDADYEAGNSSHTVAPSSYYIKDNAFSRTNGFFSIKPFRAYLTAPAEGSTSGRYELSVLDDATATGDFPELGGIVFVGIYDNCGIRRNALGKGLNIVVLGNGQVKKIIVK